MCGFWRGWSISLRVSLMARSAVILPDVSVASEHMAQETPEASLLEAFERSPRSSPEHLCPGSMSPPAVPRLSCTVVAGEVAEVLASLLCQTAGQHVWGMELGGRNTTVLLLCPNGSHKGCHNEHIHCVAAAAAVHHLQKLINEDKRWSFL